MYRGDSVMDAGYFYVPYLDLDPKVPPPTKFRNGDRVTLLRRDLYGMKGKVVAVTGQSVVVAPDGLVLSEVLCHPSEVRLEELQPLWKEVGF